MDKSKKQRGIKVVSARPQRVPNYEAWVNEPLQNLIREGLEAREWSISDLARAIGTQPSLISRWMMGARPNTGSLLAISQALGLDVRKLLVLAGYLPAGEEDSDDERVTMLRNKLGEIEMTDERFTMLNGLLETMRKATTAPADRHQTPEEAPARRRRTA